MLDDKRFGVAETKNRIGVYPALLWKMKIFFRKEIKSSRSRAFAFCQDKRAGFTLAELVVVISVMAIMASVVIYNSSTEKRSRSLQIAQSELATNLRRIQSYALASRNLPQGQVPQYYLAKFDTSNPNGYTLQAIYNVNSTSTAPVKVDLETVKFPAGVTLAHANPLAVQRATAPSTGSALTCILVAFQVPFGKAYVNEGCSFNNFSTSPPDDYRNLLNHVQNIDLYPTTTDSNATIKIQYESTASMKTVEVRGISGLVKEN